MASSLPPELIRLILQQLGHFCTIVEGEYEDVMRDYEEAAEAAERTRTLLSVCLVNRVWSKEAQVLLYANINCTQQEVLFGSAAMHSNEFANVRLNSDDSEEGELYDESLDEDSDDDGFGAAGGGAVMADILDQMYAPGESVHGQQELVDIQVDDGGDDTDMESEHEPATAEGESSRKLGEDDILRIFGTHPSDSSARSSDDSSSADGLTRIEALQRTLSSSQELASYVKTLSIYPESDEELSILASSFQVEEVCLVNKATEPDNPWGLHDGLGETLPKLQSLRQCQLHGFSAPDTYSILAALAASPSLEALRLSSFRWEAVEPVPASESAKSCFQKVRSMLVDAAAIPTPHFQAILSRLDDVSDPTKLDIRLHGISWAEEGDTYNPFAKLSRATAESITAFKLWQSALKVSDFAGLERLTSLQTLAIFSSFCLRGHSAFTLPSSITSIELGRNELDALEEDPPSLAFLVDGWLRDGKLPNLRTFSARPGDFSILDFESIHFGETYDDIAREIGSLRRKVESLQQALDAHGVYCKIRPEADLQRFMQHISPLFNESQRWTGDFERRLPRLNARGIPYTLWKV